MLITIVTMEKPVSSVICFEPHRDESFCGNRNCVFHWKETFVIVLLIGQCSSFIASHWRAVRISSHRSHVELVPVEMEWMMELANSRSWKKSIESYRLDKLVSLKFLQVVGSRTVNSTIELSFTLSRCVHWQICWPLQDAGSELMLQKVILSISSGWERRLNEGFLNEMLLIAPSDILDPPEITMWK